MSEIKRTIHEVERGVDEKGNEYEVERHIEEVEVEPALCNDINTGYFLKSFILNTLQNNYNNLSTTF